MNRECAGTMTSTGNSAVVPSSSGIRFGGNHKSHWAASPGARTSRSAGSGRRCLRSQTSHVLTEHHDGEPDQPTRSASTVARISGNSVSIERARSSNGVNDVASTGVRSYFGGSADATARVDRVPRDPQTISDLRLGNPLRSQPPNQRPIFQSDHTPIIECSLFDRQDCSDFSRHRHRSEAMGTFDHPAVLAAVE